MADDENLTQQTLTQPLVTSTQEEYDDLHGSSTPTFAQTQNGGNEHKHDQHTSSTTPSKSKYGKNAFLLGSSIGLLFAAVGNRYVCVYMS